MAQSKEAQRRARVAIATRHKIDDNLPHLISILSEMLSGDAGSMFTDYVRRETLAGLIRDLRIYVHMASQPNRHASGLLVVLDEFQRRFDERATQLAHSAYPVKAEELRRWLDDQRRLITPVMQRCQIADTFAPAQHPHAG